MYSTRGRCSHANTLWIYAQCYLLMLIGGYLFTNKSVNLVPLRWLLLFEDFDNCRRRDVTNIAGCIVLVLSWIYHRFPSFCLAGYDVLRVLPAASFGGHLTTISSYITWLLTGLGVLGRFVHGESWCLCCASTLLNFITWIESRDNLGSAACFKGLGQYGQVFVQDNLRQRCVVAQGTP
ncbi:hypothetical protein Ahy_B05g075082 [Arachis hypogaea]|uniref:Uncharacterized protein n=1 Tax=Arachis hypogaea TaxID=3818 RepID=A0A444Z0H5_ARAHY|nr:hypothetical protein Ahy_B05g075082 [Arachis hypogaea]